MRKIIASLLSAALALLPAQAINAWQIPAPTNTYTGPGDIVAFTAWYSVGFGYSRAKAAAGTTKMFRVRNTTSGELCDILVASDGTKGNTANCSGATGSVTMSSFCGTGVNACRIQTVYDQVSGNACASATCDMVQNTSGNQPAFEQTTYTYVTLSDNNTQLVSANNFTPSAAKLSLVGIGYRLISNNETRVMAGVGSNNRLVAKQSANNLWRLIGGSSGGIDATANENAWHSAVGVLDGASSVIRVDTSETTGTATASTSASAPQVGGNIGTSERWREGGFINNYAMSSQERIDVESNMRTRWGL